MHMPMCSRCGKNIAVVFVSKIENGVASSEGLCLKCAKEVGLKPVDGLMEQMGITEEDLENITTEMSSLESMMPEGDGDDETKPAEPSPGDESSEDMGRTRAYPFLDQLFGSPRQPSQEGEEDGESTGIKRDEPKIDRKSKKRKFIVNYCTDLTARAREGRLDNIVGREEETRRVIQILNRRQKNNPCLIGEPGVGKTAVAEGLAIRIAKGEVPQKLKGKEVQLLDLTALVAGTQFRGQFESRMKGLIDEVKRLGNIILVIDEVHSIVGAGDAEGSMNAANILKPALSRGEIQVIGATTFAEYRKHIEGDAALERRFQPVTVAEPSVSDTAKILMGIKGYYEDFHSVTIPDEICKQAAVLAERYITDRFLPDKAIDLIDEACSQVNLDNKGLVQIAEAKGELDSLANRRESLMQGAQNDETYVALAEIKSKELQIKERLEGLAKEANPVLTSENLAQVIELWTHIPASKVCEKEFARLMELEERLRRRIVGQDKAIEAIAAAIRRSRAGISPKKKPVSFIFVGPTGVGKTELVKALAEDLFDSPESLIRLDMSEYMEKHAVSRLVGSPPGYVGYDEAGQLTEKLRRRPYSVVLFDEIEKAHPDILNIMLQILDDGRITDAHGRVVSFENAVVVMTSNAGSDRRDSSLGFAKTTSDQSRDKAMKALSEIMRPEFINRVDEIVTFNQLSEEDFKHIAVIMLNELAESVKERNIRLSWSDELVDYLKDKAFSVKFGARNLRRLIEKEVEDSLAGQIIAAYDREISGAHIGIEDGKVAIQVL